LEHHPYEPLPLLLLLLPNPACHYPLCLLLALLLSHASC
jgi:hypothetical protein